MAAEYATDAVVVSNQVSLNRMISKYETETEELMENMVLAFLQNYSLYTLGKDSKEKLAAAVLSDVSIIDGQLVATLSGARLMWTVIFILFTLLLIVLWIFSFKRSKDSGVYVSLEVGSELLESIGDIID